MEEIDANTYKIDMNHPFFQRTDTNNKKNL